MDSWLLDFQLRTSCFENITHMDTLVNVLEWNLTTSLSPPAVGTHITTYSRTFPSGGSQRTFKVLVVGSVTCRFLTEPSGSKQTHTHTHKWEICYPIWTIGYSATVCIKAVSCLLQVWKSTYPHCKIQKVMLFTKLSSSRYSLVLPMSDELGPSPSAYIGTTVMR